MFQTKFLKIKHYERNIFLRLIIFLFIIWSLFIRKLHLLVKTPMVEQQ